VLVRPNTRDIFDGITTILKELSARQDATINLNKTFINKWDRDFNQLCDILADMTQKKQRD